jgi:hypothetical protein
MLTLRPGSSAVPFGNENWFGSHPMANQENIPPARELVPIPACTAGTPRPLSPSSLAEKKVAGIEAPEGGGSSSLDAADLGTEIHEVLSRIEWDQGKADLGSCSSEARRLLEVFLKTPEAKSLFARPGEDWDLWNEKPFDLVLGGKWISGIFDRVHIRRIGGKPVEARIYDYKTNRSTPDAIAGEYQGQMEQYRQAAASLLGLGIDQVSARTVPIRQN